MENLVLDLLVLTNRKLFTGIKNMTDLSMNDFQSVVLRIGISNPNVLSNVFRLWFFMNIFSPTEQNSIEDLCELFVITQLTVCSCLYSIPTNVLLNIVKYIWTSMNCPDSCVTIIMIYEYYVIMNMFPNDEELNMFIQNRNQIENNPNQYCIDNTRATPLKNIDKLKVKQASSDLAICSICHDTIKKGNNFIELPCKHVFHADNCLEEKKSILTWLKISKKCPNCNMVIEIS